MATPLVRVRGLSVRYRTCDAVSHAADGVSLDIERGRVFALVGESGAGKSTVGAAIPRLLPDEADVLAGEIAFLVAFLSQLFSSFYLGCKHNKFVMSGH